MAVDISINEPICANQSLVVGDGRRCLWVSTSEDIVDEKLQTFMQQKETIRNRERPQAFWDRVSLGDMSRFLPILLRETKARNVPLSKATFKDPDLAERASYDSEELRETAVMSSFLLLTFDEALRQLYGLVEQLEIPKE